ncbi:MAG: MATE family efflux transporter [Acidimicrobiia bacterium]
MRRSSGLRSPYDAEIARIALPALGALAADPLVSLIDTAFVGRLGVDALASLGVAVAVFGIAFALASFLPYGATPLIAAATGSGETARQGRLGRGTLVLAVGSGLVAFAALELAVHPVGRLMGASGVVLGGSVTYLRIRAASLPAVFIILGSHGIFRGHQDTRTPLVVSIAVSLMNLVLDPILIFGFGLDLAGAAWATVAAQWAGALVFVYLLLGPFKKRLGIDAGHGLELRRLFRAGSALILRTVSLLAALSVATAIAARIGTVAVAAHQVTFQIWLFLALVVDALAVAAQARVGAYVGSGDVEAARRVGDRLVFLGIMTGVGLALVLGAGAGVIPGWFSDDARVVAAVGSVYPFVVLSQPLNAVVFVWDGVGIGAAGFRYLASSMVAAGLVSVAALGSVLPLDLGLSGVWWALVALMVVRAVALAWWYRAGPLGLHRGRASRAA